MVEAGADDGASGPGDPPETRAARGRRAEALRANLRRRKAQARAREEARPDAAGAAGPGRDG